MTPAEAQPLRGIGAWPFGRLVALCCLAVIAIAWVSRANVIETFGINDPDDYMRLAQVRDWIAGQGWFDVRQHRLTPPIGGDMHWSRLVDIPIAGLILFFTPIVGAARAELAAMILVPAALLAITMTLLAYAARRIIAREGALLAALLLTTSPLLFAQFAPLRIDHHGWQIAMAALTLLALLDDRQVRSGLLAGVAAAVWTHISIEGLPYLALVGALLAARYLRDRREGDRLVAYLVALCGASVLLFVGTKAPALWADARCDAMTMPYLVPIFGVTALIGIGARHPATEGAVLRAGLLAAAALLGVGLLALVARECLSGPFVALDPLVHRFWYMNVFEGLPLWKQPSLLALGSLWPSLIGGAGIALGWHAAADGDQRRRWTTLAVLFAGAFGISLLVFRAQSVAHLYGMVGCAYLVLAMLRRIRRLQRAAWRVPLTVIAIALPSPVPAGEALVRIHFDAQQKAELKRARSREGCTNGPGLAGLATQPPSVLMASLDIGPAILAFTHHSVVAAGYHRNSAAMRDIILAFTEPPATAERIARHYDVRYLVYCQNLPETRLYKQANPDGLLARLERNNVPGWLERVPVGGSPDMRLYRIRPAS